MQKRIRVEGSAEMEIHHFIMKPINIICSFRTFGSNVTHTDTHTQVVQTCGTQAPAYFKAPQVILMCHQVCGPLVQKGHHSIIRSLYILHIAAKESKPCF